MVRHRRICVANHPGHEPIADNLSARVYKKAFSRCENAKHASHDWCMPKVFCNMSISGMCAGMSMQVVGTCLEGQGVVLG